MFRERMIFAGAGGQGALRAGQMMAYAGLREGREASWLPSYGAEMRGGTANCSVIISDRAIPFPMVSEADCCVVMNAPSLARFEPRLRLGGLLILNSSLMRERPLRADLRACCVPAGQIAEEEGNPQGANMVLLGACVALCPCVSPDSVREVVFQSFTGAKSAYAEGNRRAFDRGFQFANAGR
jgi:2-oxoglutarate ferredoxin oxidoreductase subunit gamma